MIPSNAMAPSLEAGTGVFLTNRSQTFGLTPSICRGGANVGDGSQGIDLQDWQCSLVGSVVHIDPQTSGSSVTVTLTGVTAVCMAFDRAVQPSLAYMVGGTAYLRWYDSLTHDFVTQTFGGASRIMVVHDDVRDTSSSTSDVIVTYQRDDGIFWRQQRDRYAVEYTAHGPTLDLLTSFGMGTKNRLLWRVV